MAYSMHPNERKTSVLLEECEYLSRLIQQHKHFNGRKGTTSFATPAPAAANWVNFRTGGSVNASVSKYKKVNVSTRPQVPLVGQRRMCVDNRLPQSSRKDAGLLTPAISSLPENHSLTYGTPSDQCQNVFDSRSSRMYLNPHFFKTNCSAQTNASAKHITSESEMVCASKHSVHINPKVLARQVMKLTTKSQPAQVSVVANRCAVSKKHGVQFQTCEIPSEPSGTNPVTSRYAFHSKTKLVKHNALVYQTGTGNILRNSGTSSQSVPKKKLSPVIKSSLPGPLLSISRTKMVRAKPEAVRPCMQGLVSDRPSVSVPDDFSTPLKTSKSRSLSSGSKIRPNSFKSSTLAVKAAKAVCSKYKSTRFSVANTPLTKYVYNCATNKATSSQVSRYKIDRRLYKTPKRVKNVKKYSLQYRTPKRGKHNQQSINHRRFSRHRNVQYSFLNSKFGNKTWNKSLCPRKVLIVDNKLRRVGNSPNLRKGQAGENNRQGSSLVWIGGVLYRTSKLKLTRSLTPKCKNGVARSTQNNNVKKSRTRSSFAVYVRGNKFLMDAAGKTLLRVPQRTTNSAISGSSTSIPPLKRIDIGGVTFVQKSTNVLMRTNTHNTRSLLSQAKQKSIALLTNKMKKSNQPCTFYRRFGKCVRKEKGTCPHVHDPKQVAVCKKFLQGCCTATDCTLSHDVGPEKMPTCKYFLEGCCVRDNCRYVHVKVSAKAGICKNFLRGYCPDGQKCRKRHTDLCPEFEKAGSCPKGKYCAYPHKTVVEKRAQTQKHTTAPDKAHVTATDERKRYYETGEMVSVEFSAEPVDLQVAHQVDSGDLNVKRLKLLKKVDDMKRAWQNAQCHTDGQMVASPDQIHEAGEPEVKRPKLGILPAYIPLGSSP